MKAGWVVRQLSEIALLQGGFAFKSTEYTPTGHRLIRIANVQDGYLSDEKPKFVELDDKTARFQLEEGDLLTSLTGNVGRVGKMTSELLPAALNQRVLRIKAAAPETVHHDYLELVLKSRLFREYLEDRSHGAAQANVSPKAVATFPVPLPPLEEQQRIVAILDEAFEGLDRAKANAEANLASARDLFQSALEEAFTVNTQRWLSVALRELGQITTGSTPKTSEPENYGSELPFVKPGHFRPDGSLTYDEIGLSASGRAKARTVPAGSALMVCIGATIGKAGFADREVATNQQINAISPKASVDGKFLYFQMLTGRFQRAVIAGSGQATLPIINKSKWGELTVRVPPEYRVQAEIVEKLQAVRARLDVLTEHYQARQLELDQLRQSLLAKAFAGELT